VGSNPGEQGSDPVVNLSGLSSQQLLRFAEDPASAPDLLRVLATDHPQTRVAIASNPAADSALLQWLDGLGDPSVSAAITSRSQHMPPVSSVQGFPGGQVPSTARKFVWIGIPAAVAVLVVAAIAVIFVVIPALKTVISADSRPVVASDIITVGYYPGTPVVAPDGTVYVPNYGDGTVSVMSNGQVTDTITVGRSPGTPVVAPDGAIYVPNRDDDTVSVIDDGRVTDTITVGNGPLTPAVAPDGTIYVPNHFDNTISVLR
jgi:YVTN family beta-propeller protein